MIPSDEDVSGPDSASTEPRLIRKNDVLAEVCRALARSEDPGKILQEAAERLQNYFGAASIGIWCVEEDCLHLRGLALPSFLGDEVEAAIREGFAAVSLDSDLPGPVAIGERRTFRFPSLDTALHPEILDILDAIGADTLLAIPIFLEGEPAAAGLVSAPLDHALTGADEALLEDAFRVLAIVHQRAHLQEIRKQHHVRALRAYHMAMVGELAAGVAHEVNNPLNTILHLAELLLMDRDLSAGIRDDLETMLREARRAGTIVRNLLTFAQQDESEKGPVDLSEAVKSVIRIKRHQLELVNIELEVEMEADSPPAKANPAQIQQILHNLITNARQAIEEEGTGGRIRIRVGSAGGDAELRVEDTGYGIPDELRESIFEPFFTTRGVGEGAGLGLAVAYGAIREHGGEIWAENWGHPPALGGAAGEGGARIVVRLPAHTEAEPVPAAKGAEGGPGEPGREGEARVLVVDDEPDVLGAVTRLLRRTGFEVDSASTGEEALELLEAGETYDAILTDLRMPGMGGTGLYRRIREDHPNLESRVVFATGDIVSSETRRFFQEVDRPVLNKPFELADLREVLTRIIPP